MHESRWGLTDNKQLNAQSHREYAQTFKSTCIYGFIFNYVYLPINLYNYLII